MSYFLIVCSEDGDISVTPYNKDELLEAIIEEDHDYIKFMQNIKDTNPQYWGNSRLIIKGEIVTPEPKDVVKEYDIL